ncbi:MAG: tRNA epoxyqueuosine(34) reductase QueG [bacterium]
MKNLIKKSAVECGFSLCGVSSAAPVDDLPYLEVAIEEGRVASMKYLVRDPAGRCDPRALFPAAKSVICCALAHRFARGADYHDEVKQKLGLLWDAIRGRAPDARAKICVDTSPILEKALAQRAGLGWIGKHTVLVNRELGSWFVLGEIITDLEIEPDPPHDDLCGDCTKCLEACPTRAIISPRELDARKCISFLTLEAPRLRSAGSELQAATRGFSYGCDICQEACPYNAFDLFM